MRFVCRGGGREADRHGGTCKPVKQPVGWMPRPQGPLPKGEVQSLPPQHGPGPAPVMLHVRMPTMLAATAGSGGAGCQVARSHVPPLGGFVTWENKAKRSDWGQRLARD